jgi:hypothetical protein
MCLVKVSGTVFRWCWLAWPAQRTQRAFQAQLGDGLFEPILAAVRLPALYALAYRCQFCFLIVAD